MEEWAGKINANNHNLGDPVQDVGLELRFEEQLGSQDMVMKRKCMPSVRNRINNCKQKLSLGNGNVGHRQSIGFGIRLTCIQVLADFLSVTASSPMTSAKTYTLPSIWLSFS